MLRAPDGNPVPAGNLMLAGQRVRLGVEVEAPPKMEKRGRFLEKKSILPTGIAQRVP